MPGNFDHSDIALELRNVASRAYFGLCRPFIAPHRSMMPRQ
jgi:hypothetical protein